MSNLLRLLMTKECWEQFALFLKRIAFSFTKSKRIARKTDERIPNPACDWLWGTKKTDTCFWITQNSRYLCTITIFRDLYYYVISLPFWLLSTTATHPPHTDTHTHIWGFIEPLNQISKTFQTHQFRYLYTFNILRQNKCCFAKQFSHKKKCLETLHSTTRIFTYTLTDEGRAQTGSGRGGRGRWGGG